MTARRNYLYCGLLCLCFTPHGFLLFPSAFLGLWIVAPFPRIYALYVIDDKRKCVVIFLWMGIVKVKASGEFTPHGVDLTSSAISCAVCIDPFDKWAIRIKLFRRDRRAPTTLARTSSIEFWYRFDLFEVRLCFFVFFCNFIFYVRRYSDLAASH